MHKCRMCYSQAINPGKHGRCNADPDLCDVCYWRVRAELFAERLRWYIDNDDTNDTEDNKPWLAGKQAAIEALRRLETPTSAVVQPQPAPWRPKLIPHPSHNMTEWASTVVSLTGGTPRLGRLRMCKSCEGEHAITGTGEAMQDVLDRKCPEVE